jgi:hypothetical protein
MHLYGILAQLDDPPDTLAELRGRLLDDHRWRTDAR